MKFYKILLLLLVPGITLFVQPFLIHAADNAETFYEFQEGILYQEAFEDGDTSIWKLENGWAQGKEDGRNVLSGSGHRWAVHMPSQEWSDYILSFDFKLQGQVNICFRHNWGQGDPLRYFLSIHQGGYTLLKQLGKDIKPLLEGQKSGLQASWHRLSIDADSNTFKIHLDKQLLINYTDRENPIYSGGIAFETLDNSCFYIDNIEVSGAYTTQKASWEKTGGPLGGLGYDVRINPENKSIMFVTDNPSGVNKSLNGGKTWFQANEGITTRIGSSNDDIPIFCLAIDPNDPDIIWTGTDTARGIFKSLDCGRTWIKMDNGITENNEITFRGFAVKPGDSDVVFAAAEINKGLFGKEFARQKGKIYKTTDGGEHWVCVWEGGSLARVIIFDPVNPDILYASTGIFDREAYNTVGEGVLKSTDGGNTWTNINNGLENLFIGFLDMHPKDPDTLICAAGNYTYGEGSGIYITHNGGREWTKALQTTPGNEPVTVVRFSSSNPNIVYAGFVPAFYRSVDGGVTWQRFTKQEVGIYGPPGVRAGIPISVDIDPDDPMVLFVNNYGGGVFKSTDGAETWMESSIGYTGANVHQVVVSPADQNTIYAIGRSGPFISSDGGQKWMGLAFNPIQEGEWNDIAVCPSDSRLVLCSDEFTAKLFRSSDGGQSWSRVFSMIKKEDETPTSRHGFKTIEFAPSNANVVYAGMRKERLSIDGSNYKGPSFGMFKSVDGGNTWNQINSGLENTDRNINCIAVHPGIEDIVYIGTYLDGVFKSTNGGKSWSAASSGLMSEDVRSLAIDPINPEIIYAGLGNGVGLYKTENGGESWNATSNGIVVECPSYLQRIGQVNPGISLEKPVRTVGTDYASTPWTLMSSVVIFPSNPEILFVSDYQRGVYMTTTGGESWVPINKGLDFKAVTSLALSKNEAVLYASTSGGGVYRLELGGK
ncbi:MAG TPA: hypothetical protein VEG39_19775 [Clostridia bacterium]|nr:hypothetical protein [Clostridia bacterium]